MPASNCRLVDPQKAPSSGDIVMGDLARSGDDRSVSCLFACLRRLSPVTSAVKPGVMRPMYRPSDASNLEVTYLAPLLGLAGSCAVPVGQQPG